MRNIKQYPITDEEILEVINQIPENKGIGGLNNLIKSGIQQYFSNPEHINELVEQLRIK